MPSGIEEFRRRCSAFGNYLPDDKKLCGRCEARLKEACMAYTIKNRL